MIEICTDGSCKNNPGSGAFAIIVMKNNIITKAYRKESNDTTNNREELKAIIAAIQYAINNKNETFIIYTDSSYAEKSINIWMYNWVLNDWKNTKNQTIQNLDLFHLIYKYYNENFINFQVVKTKGHSNILGNELADAAATGNAKKIKEIFQKNDVKYTFV